MRLLRLGSSTRVRVLLWVVGAALALELLYVLAALVVLRTGLLEKWLSSDPQELEVRFESATSYWPGQVQVRGFSLRSRDSNMELLLKVREARLQVNLFALPARRFEASHVRAEGTSFRMRSRVEAVAGDELRLRAYPPIPGLPDPPLKPWNVPHKKLASTPFTIRITDVDASFEELWIVEYRFTGRGRARGGFELFPGRRVLVEPASVHFDSGQIALGAGKLVARSIAGSVKAHIEQFDVKAVRGWRVFDQLTAAAELKVDIDSFAFARIYPGLTRTFSLSGGRGPLVVQAKMERGAFLPGSNVQFTSEYVQYDKPPLQVAGDALVRLRVSEGAQPLLTFAMSAARLELRGLVRKTRAKPALALRPSMVVSTHTLKVSDSWRMASGEFKLPDLQVPDLSVINSLLDERAPVDVRAGSATASASASITSKGALAAQLSAALDAADFEIPGKAAVKLSGTVTAHLNQDEVGAKSALIEPIKIAARPVHIVTREGATGNGSIQIDDGSFRLREAAPGLARATVRGSFADAKPVLAALGIHFNGLSQFASSLVDTSNLRATAELAHAGAVTDVALREARTDGLRSSGRWRKTGDSKSAAFLVDLSVGKLGVSVHDSETDLDPFVGSDWLGKELARLGLQRPAL